MKVENRNFPHFIVVGTMKSGTTTIKDYLVNHPEVFMPDNELFFFNSDSSYKKGKSFYMKKFGGYSDQKIIGEKTTTYSYDPKVAERIYSYNPDVKLIWIFRDPVSRSYTQYWHAVKEGKELLSFEKAIELEEERVKKNLFKGYLKRSIYIEQIENYLKYFSLDQMHFIVFEDMVKDQNMVLKRLSSFLGIDYYPLDQTMQSNKTYLPRSKQVQFFARTLFGSSIFYKGISKINRRITSGYPPMKVETRQKLEDYFTSFNSELRNKYGVKLRQY